MTQIRAEKLYQDATSYVTCNLYEMCHVILNTLRIIHDNGLLLSTDFQIFTHEYTQFYRMRDQDNEFPPPPSPNV